MNGEQKTSGGAIWSLVLGILGVTCLGPLGAIPAIICGHVSRKNIANSNGALQGEGVALAGLILGYVGLALMLVMIPMCAAIAIPSFVKARNQSQLHACINNMRIVDAGKEQWAMANRKVDGDAADTNGVNQYVKGGVTPVCPAGGSYTYNPMGRDPACSVHGSLNAPVSGR